MLLWKIIKPPNGPPRNSGCSPGRQGWLQQYYNGLQSLASDDLSRFSMKSKLSGQAVDFLQRQHLTNIVYNARTRHGDDLEGSIRTGVAIEVNRRVCMS